jgi:hypothetical protein
MSRKPYVIAGVGSIMGSPAAIWLTVPNSRESALARLYDVFRIGVQGAAYQELLDWRTRSGQTAQSVQDEWEACEHSVLWEMRYAKVPDEAPEEVLATWRVCDREAEREGNRAVRLARRMGL